MIDEASRKIAEAEVVARGACGRDGGARTVRVSAALDQLTEDQREIIGLVRQFTDEQVMPVASELEHEDISPTRSSPGCASWASSGSRSPRSTAASAST